MGYYVKYAFLTLCLVFMPVSSAFSGSHTLNELFNPEVMQRELNEAFTFANNNEFDFDLVNGRIVHIRDEFFALANAKPPAWEDKAFNLFQQYINYVAVRFSMLATGIVMNRKETQDSYPLTIASTWPLFDELVKNDILKCDRSQYEKAYTKYIAGSLKLNMR